ncbi:hypothetical protein [Gracilibacillus sp. JCM 18860]
MGDYPDSNSHFLGIIGITFIISGTKWWQKQKEEINKRNKEFQAEQNKEI